MAFRYNEADRAAVPDARPSPAPCCGREEGSGCPASSPSDSMPPGPSCWPDSQEAALTPAAGQAPGTARPSPPATSGQRRTAPPNNLLRCKRMATRVRRHPRVTPVSQTMPGRVRLPLRDDGVIDSALLRAFHRVAWAARSVMPKTTSPISAACGMGPRDGGVPQRRRTDDKHVPTR